MPTTSRKLKTMTAGFERLDQVAQRLEIAHDRLETSIEATGSYHPENPEPYDEWNDRQNQLWYSSDRIHDHVAELRRVLRRVARLRTKPAANAGPLSAPS